MAVAPLYEGSAFILRSPKIESKKSEMCQLSFQYHILKMNGYPTLVDEAVAILAIFMIEIHGELNSTLPFIIFHLPEDGTRSKLALDTLDVPNGCLVVSIPTHTIKNRKYQFEFEARDSRN